MYRLTTPNVVPRPAAWTWYYPYKFVSKADWGHSPTTIHPESESQDCPRRFQKVLKFRKPLADRPVWIDEFVTDWLCLWFMARSFSCPHVYFRPIYLWPYFLFNSAILHRSHVKISRKTDALLIYSYFDHNPLSTYCVLGTVLNAGTEQ